MQGQVKTNKEAAKQILNRLRSRKGTQFEGRISLKDVELLENISSGMYSDNGEPSPDLLLRRAVLTIKEGFGLECSEVKNLVEEASNYLSNKINHV